VGRSWQSALLKAFSGREPLSSEEMWRSYWPDLDREAVEDLLSLISAEYQISPRVLRPSDRLETFFRTPTTANPFKWLVWETRSSDRKSEINMQLHRKQKHHSTAGMWSNIDTVDDLVRVWCGCLPSTVRKPNK
jgi:hypothetical protein